MWVSKEIDHSEYDLLNYLANLKTFTLKFIKLNLFFERL
jgi:hypothetical protein